MVFEQERINRILQELKGYIYPKKVEIKSLLMKKGDFSSPQKVDENNEQWKVYNSSDIWGGKDERYWFKTEVTIPEEFHGETVVFQIETGREGQWDAINPQFLIYVNGEIVQGLDVNHRDIIISENVKGGERYRIDLHAYAGMKEETVYFKSHIAVLDRNTEKIFYDIKVPLETTKLLDKEDKRRIDCLHFLGEAINLLDSRIPHSAQYYSSIKEVDKFLSERFYGEYCGNSDVTASCVGHTHIDVAWLWTLRQTREKVARSFSTVLNLMKQYPEYLFMSSQPQLYKFLKEEHPDLYGQVKEKIAEGKWEADGGMWLEADCNLASGESLIRQILFGARFFREEFGVENKILWLPDVFGYSAALPQILQKFGIKYFMTTKISWNEYNKMPYDTFMWEGIDGSEILSYFVTTIEYEKAVKNINRTLYEGFLNPSNMKGAWHRYQQKNINDDILITYGYGDGGGGPTKEQFENARRMEKGIPGCPRVKMSTAGEYFTKLEKKVMNNKNLPKWVGELYLEYHRGTYTTMGRNKRFNRKSEFLLQDVEFFNILNTSLNEKSIYPKDKINRAWEIVLLNQFHDIIPGSSIKEVYDESQEQYREVFKNGNNMLEHALNNITENINIEEKSLVVFNQLSFERSDVITFSIPEGMGNIELVDSKGKTYDVQIIHNNQSTAFVEGIPSKGYKTFKLREVSEKPQVSTVASEKSISSRYFHIELNEEGNITSIYDKLNNREVIKKGEKANILQAFEDKPHNFDAWDINIYYQEKMWEINEVDDISVFENGPVRTTLKIKKRFLNSTIVQYIHLYNNIPRIDFQNEIQWEEKHILLKAAFPVDIHTDKATYEIQFGNVERPTHWNTSWDLARFEVCAHKWADISEDNYGVSILNDCKYGHDIKDGVMRLSLLKSPTWPNPEADREMHKFTYSLYPHSGNWKGGGTVSMAYSLNCPMYAKIEENHQGTLPQKLSFLNIDKENVVIETVKKAEDSNEMIIRMYECYNRRSTVTVNFLKKLAYVKEVDLSEKEIGEIDIDGENFTFEIKPYEIRTFKIALR